ncbi:UNVERIFIED_CONTAM: hypothetical protein HDU68_009170 [Siphonaria sp. JEL0065]|nr:hypothetical protein HDU68_009170 [Siphonaria sp. JEL0065]
MNHLDATTQQKLAVAVVVTALTLLAVHRILWTRGLRQTSKAHSKPRPRRLDIDIDYSAAAQVNAKPAQQNVNSNNNTAKDDVQLPDMARQMTTTLANKALNLPPSLQLQQALASSNSTSASIELDPAVVRAIVERLLETAVEEPPTSAFKNAIAGLSGKPAVGSGSTMAVRESTGLPPFHAQIAHIVNELKSAKQRGRPVLIEGPPGLGKGTALRQYISDEGQSRPAVYLQLSNVLRKRHGSSSLDEDEEEAESVAFTETDTEMEGEEKVLITVKRDAWINALKNSLGFRDGDLPRDSTADAENPSLFSLSEDSSPSRRTSLLQRQLGLSQAPPLESSINMRSFNHIAQSLRLIAARCKAGPVLLIIDDIQLLFRERVALTDRYDGIPEIFEWLLKCEVEGILDVTFCSSEKSAIGALKRLRGYDWAIKLHAVESVEDDTVISYLMTQVNPCIKEPSRRFTEETAALFVATFDGSLLELDNYFRDVHCANVHDFIAKRERSFLRRLQRHLPSRIRHSLNQPPNISSSSSANNNSNNQNPLLSPPASARNSTTITASDYLNSYSYKQPQLSTEEELRELFLDIMMRGGILPVAQLSLARMSLVESLVERNILRWRDSRIRKRENRAMHQRESGKGSTAGSRSGGSSGAGGSVGGASSSASGYVAVSPNPGMGSGKKQRVFGASRNDGWFGMTPAQQAMAAPSWGNESEWDSVAATGASVAGGDDDWSVGGSASMLQSGFTSGYPGGDEEDGVVVSDVGGDDSLSPLSPTTHGIGHDLTMDNQWAGANSNTADGVTELVKNMDAAEQLALFAMEDAELVWSNHLVRNVCEGFVSGTQMQW